MLEFYGRIARRLQGTQSVFGVIAALGAVTFVALIFLPGVPAGPTYAFLAITIVLWSFFLNLVVKRFSIPLPVIEPVRAVQDPPAARRAFGIGRCVERDGVRHHGVYLHCSGRSSQKSLNAMPHTAASIVITKLQGNTNWRR